MKNSKSLLKPILLIISIALLVFVFIDYRNSRKKTINKPTKEFYINDSINVLLNSTKWYIFLDGKDYFEDTTTDLDNPKDLMGVQIVVGTYNKAELIDSTKIFNTYKIGKNDLGILLLMGYQEIGEEYVFDDLLFEIGTKMSTFISAFEMANLIDQHFYNYGSTNDYDAKIVNLYYELIELTAVRIYGYNPNWVYDYFLNSEDYYYEQYTITRKLDSDKFTFSPLQVSFFIVAIVLLLGTSGFNLILLIITNSSGGGARGGGGKSHGYYARK